MYKLVRITTVPISLQKLIAGQMKFMGDHAFSVSMISSDFDGKEQLETDEQAEFIIANMSRVISPLTDLKSLYNLIKILKKLKPTIVHTHTPKAGLLGMLASRITRVPIRLHTVAGLPLMETRGIKRKILEWVEQITYSCASQVYPNSNNLRNFIIANNFSKTEKIKIIGNGSSNGIDTTYFKINEQINAEAEKLKNQFELTTNSFLFVFVGRIVKDKGIEELVQAFTSLQLCYPHIKLLLVGDFESDLDPVAKKTVAIIKDNPDIIHVGFQKDVRPYLAMSHALAFPSYREGFPNVPMQAGCFDLPAIVTDINGCNEIIIDGVNGLIIPPKNALALQNAMEHLITDKAMYADLKGNARRLIVERYEQAHFWSLLLKEYQEQLSRHEIVS